MEKKKNQKENKIDPNKLFEYQKIAEARGGSCLETEYKGAHYKILFKCGICKHEWKAKPTNIKSGNWCPKCAGKVVDPLEKLAGLQLIALQKKGRLLSLQYVGWQKEYEWMCHCGHIWLATMGNIKRGTWCPKCAGQIRKSLIECQIFALSKNGKCLSTIVPKWNEHMIWECEIGHVWNASFNNIFRGKWCPKCAGNNLGSIEELKQLAVDRGGICLSTEYSNSKSKYKWQCKFGHIWVSVASSVKNGTWCPYCSSYFGEEYVRCAIETITGCKFPKLRPLWLKKGKSRYELDGYSEELKIAFEHQGRQHYECDGFFNNTTDQLMKRMDIDNWKMMKAKKRGVSIIVIPDVPKQTNYDEVIPYLMNRLMKLGIKNLNVNAKVHTNKIYTRKHLKNLARLKETVTQKNGTLDENSFIGMRAKVKVTCEFGHTWFPEARFLLKTWCGKCKNRGLTIDDLNFEFKSIGIQVAQNFYPGFTINIKWKCSKGHFFDASLKSMRGRNVCIVCNFNNLSTDNSTKMSKLERRFIQQKISENKLMQILKKREAVALTAYPEKQKDKIKIRCKNGHDWNVRVEKLIHRGDMCPFC